jgi:hypothetical protein
MKYALILALLLTGCSTLIPVKQPFPPFPNELAVECPDLKQLPADTKKLSDVVSNVSENYGTYYECQARKEAWVEWYKAQKQIHDGVK